MGKMAEDHHRNEEDLMAHDELPARRHGPAVADARKTEALREQQLAELDELFDRLEYAEDPFDAVRALIDGLGLPEKDIALAAGVTPTSVSRWVNGDVSSMHARDVLNDLRYVVLALLNTRRMSKSRIAYWLSARNLFLGVTPLEAIARGDFEHVVEAGRAHAEGRRPERPPVKTASAG
jgi:transcriptional regulator with XRE-family HTH domain